MVNNGFFQICRRIAEGLGEVIPNLETLVLTNNHLQELGDLDPLAEFSKLTYLSLLSNPVANKQHYRSYVINKLPSLRVLDFRKVKLKVVMLTFIQQLCSLFI
jgi:U2 small nuclear ribonucleoprotein A'